MAAVNDVKRMITCRIYETKQIIFSDVVIIIRTNMSCHVDNFEINIFEILVSRKKYENGRKIDTILSGRHR